MLGHFWWDARRRFVLAAADAEVIVHPGFPTAPVSLELFILFAFGWLQHTWLHWKCCWYIRMLIKCRNELTVQWGSLVTPAAVTNDSCSCHSTWQSLPLPGQVPQPTCYWKWHSWQLGNLTTLCLAPRHQYGSQSCRSGWQNLASWFDPKKSSKCIFEISVTKMT